VLEERYPVRAYSLKDGLGNRRLPRSRSPGNTYDK
jgi:hypothetical protein